MPIPGIYNFDKKKITIPWPAHNSNNLIFPTVPIPVHLALSLRLKLLYHLAFDIGRKDGSEKCIVHAATDVSIREGYERSRYRRRSSRVKNHHSVQTSRIGLQFITVSITKGTLPQKSSPPNCRSSVSNSGS